MNSRAKLAEPEKSGMRKAAIKSQTAMEACLASLHTTPDYSFPFSLDSKKQPQDSFKAAPSSGELVDLRCSLKSRALGYSTGSKASRWSYTAAHECIRLCSRTWCAVVQPLAMQLLD